MMTTFREVLDYVIQNPHMIGWDNPLLWPHCITAELYVKYQTVRNMSNISAAQVHNLRTIEETIDHLTILACYYGEF